MVCFSDAEDPDGSSRRIRLYRERAVLEWAEDMLAAYDGWPVQIDAHDKVDMEPESVA